jgi:Chalcone isomerase-like
MLVAWTFALTTACSPAWAQATAPVELAGVKYAPAVNLGDAALQLNGAGIRYRFVVQVYTAGLYLQAKADTPEAVLAAPGPKRLHVVMLRDIDASELGRLFTRGMQENAAKEEFSKSIPGTIKMADIFSAKKRLAKGENFSVDYQPGVGTQVLVNGKPAGETIVEPEFFRALIGIWLGPNPADAALKQALLGRAAVSNNPRQR